MADADSANRAGNRARGEIAARTQFPAKFAPECAGERRLSMDEERPKPDGGDLPRSHGMAKRLRHKSETLDKLVVMSIIVCDQCGARFAIGHRPAFQDASLAERQAAWLVDQFVWDHIQENKHPGSKTLPGPDDLKPASEN